MYDLHVWKEKEKEKKGGGKKWKKQSELKEN
jgi:hypothetical protein